MHEAMECFFWGGYFNWNFDVKIYNAKKYNLQKGIIKSYKVVTNQTNSYGPPINSYIKL